MKILYLMSLMFLSMHMPVAAQCDSHKRIVDVHTHIIVPEYIEVLKAHGAEMEETFPLPVWNAEQHIAFMDSAGIRTAVLTMPAPQPYYGDAEESAECIRRVNEISAEIKKKYPDRFKFCAALPLPDVDAAVREAVYALDTLGADGVKLATNSRGQYLGDEALEPLMKVLDERHAVIIIHPHRPSPYAEEIIAATPLAMYEYPAETTRAVVNMLAHNVPTRYPNLKIVVPHCGSFLPLALPRMKYILPAMVKQSCMRPIDWEGNLSRLYYDLAGNPTAEVIRSLLTITSPDHLLYGSDYPYLPDAVLKANLQKLKQTLFSDEELKQYADKILWKNAGQLFRAEKDICDSEMLIRISEIEVYPEYLDEYLSFARNVGAESVCKEQGVICIYPMIQKRDSCQIRILEIYASQEAYKKHIASEHFQTYKQGTLHMVKSLDLVDMLPMNPEGMDEIFKKMNTYNIKKQ